MACIDVDVVVVDIIVGNGGGGKGGVDDDDDDADDDNSNMVDCFNSFSMDDPFDEMDSFDLTISLTMCNFGGG